MCIRLNFLSIQKHPLKLYNKIKHNKGGIINYFLNELGRVGRENIWLSDMPHGPLCARSVSHDLEPDIFLHGPPTQSINIYYLPAGRSVLRKTVPEVLSTARGRRPRAVLKTEGTVFLNTDLPAGK